MKKMSITFEKNSRVFHIFSKSTQYTMYIDRSERLCHAYFGRKVRNLRTDRIEKEFEIAYGQNLLLDIVPQEYPAYGNTDFREPAYRVQLENGSTVSDLRYLSHRIIKGKPKLQGLPSTYVEEDSEAQTLEIDLYDGTAKLKVTLVYTAFENFDAIARSVRFENEGASDLKLLRALSASLDLRGDGFSMIQLSGAWARERNVVRRPLSPGVQSIDSKRGASSHQHNPFFALVRENTDEWTGEAYGFSLVYSGNFLAQAEVDSYGNSRVSIGINPFDFSWLLKPGESFRTPEAVMVYSDEGLNGMSKTFHRLYRTRLARGKYRDAERPILVNNWEATYFDFDDEKLLEIAEEAKDLGIELFVLDDGWFGKRNSDNSSLGDWHVNREKLTEGLDGLVKRVNDLGLKFGLWVEPEMVSPDSELYRNHPDWCIHVPNRERNTWRNQLVLDLSRDDVCDYIVKSMTDLLESADISYVKWDMNRNMTEIGSEKLPAERQRETAHRYILGLYRILDKVTSAFPDILFESCAGGGGRFDPGMLYYMPQAWTSDDTDAVERLKIQYGTSLVYPPVVMGSHISAIPNHQVGRMTSIDMRARVAMAANFGFELDLTGIGEEEKRSVKEHVKEYKGMRKLVQFGDFYRLSSPFEENETSWMIENEDGTEFILYHYTVLNSPNAKNAKIRVRGIDPERDYELLGTGEVYGGDELIFEGITIPRKHGDFQSTVMHFRAI